MVMFLRAINTKETDVKISNILFCLNNSRTVKTYVPSDLVNLNFVPGNTFHSEHTACLPQITRSEICEIFYLLLLSPIFNSTNYPYFTMAKAENQSNYDKFIIMMRTLVLFLKVILNMVSNIQVTIVA